MSRALVWHGELKKVLLFLHANESHSARGYKSYMHVQMYGTAGKLYSHIMSLTIDSPIQTMSHASDS